MKKPGYCLHCEAPTGLEGPNPDNATCGAEECVEAVYGELYVPPCAASMGCLCSGHARGADAGEPCDTSEEGDAA